MCEHDWQDPPELDWSKSIDSKDINFMLTGQVCTKCGSERIYEGPMFGWKIIKEGPDMRPTK